MKRRVYAAMACVGALLAVGGVSAATVQAEPSDAVLNEYVVTAQRMQTKELDTPADVQVITAKQIEASGASNAYEALQNVLGVTGQTQGFYGTSMSTMTSKIMIRGVEKGTLVLVDGVSISADGKYNLDDISADMIKKIEVIRGGGSVMYGSDATGGVINIITKTKSAKSVSVGVGNYGQRKYNVSMSEDGLTVIGSITKKGEASPMSGYNYRDPNPKKTSKKMMDNKTRYNYEKGDLKNLFINYDFKNGLMFTTRLINNSSIYNTMNDGSVYKGAMSSQNEYIDKTRNALLRYHKNGWDAKLSYDMQQKQNDKTEYTKLGTINSSGLYSWRDDRITTLDVQKEFKSDSYKFILGGQISKEDLHLRTTEKKDKTDKSGKSTGSKNVAHSGNQAAQMGNKNTKSKDPFYSTYKRIVGSLYASYIRDLNSTDTLIVSGRQTWAGGNEGRQLDEKDGTTTVTTNDSMSRFTPEVQYLHRIGDHQSVYARIGQSFRLPNLTQIYGNGLINPSVDLRPEHGTNYEIGYKSNTKKADYRLTLFHYDLKDAIEAQPVYKDDGTVKVVNYKNQNQKNTGIEAGVVYRYNSYLSGNFGIMYQNPLTQSKKTYDDMDWHKIYNRWQITTGVNYAKNKWNTGLSMNWVLDRTSTDSSQRHLKSQLFTDLDLQYKPNADQKIQLHINNLLNRRDITTNSSSTFYTLGRNYVLTYKYNF